MAIQTHTAAQNPLKTVYLSAATIASATLRATLRAALVAAPYLMSGPDADDLLNRLKATDLFIDTGILYMSDAGQVADNTMMVYVAGDKRFIRNNHYLLKIATVFADVPVILRFELYS